MIKISKSKTLIAIALMYTMIPATIIAAVTVDVRFLNPRMQVFIVGDVLKSGAIEEGGDIDLNDFTEFFSIKIASPDQLDTKVYVRFYEDLNDTRLIDYRSSSNADKAFTLRKWVEESGGTGFFSNTDISRIESSGWFERDRGQTSFADVTTILESIENGLFPTSTFTLGVQVYDLNNTLLANFTRIIKVFNPASPLLSQPVDESTPANLNSIQFSWTWPSGGQAQTVTSDWELVIVDAGAEKPDDPEAVISDRTASNTRFTGSPQAVTGHNYTGTGGESELLKDRWYCWQVKVNAPATLAPPSSSSIKPYTSEVRTFSTIPDPRLIQGYSSILYTALMTDGGDLTFVMEDIKDQFRGYVPTQAKKGRDGENLASQTAVDEISAKEDTHTCKTEVQ